MGPDLLQSCCCCPAARAAVGEWQSAIVLSKQQPYPADDASPALSPRRYCTALNVFTAAAAAQPAAAKTTQKQQQHKAGAKPGRTSAAAVTIAQVGSSGSSSATGSAQQQVAAASVSSGSRRRAGSISSGARYVLAQTAASASPELPPVLHNNCQKHFFLQKLDHFAASPAQPGDREPGGPGGCGSLWHSRNNWQSGMCSGAAYNSNLSKPFLCCRQL
jgi:hypothetical protein